MGGHLYLQFTFEPKGISAKELQFNEYLWRFICLPQRYYVTDGHYKADGK